jgi:hypothetical protein
MVAFARQFVACVREATLQRAFQSFGVWPLVVMAVLLLALAGCSGGGGSSGGQTGTCMDAATCLASFGDAYTNAGNAIGSAIASGADGGFGCFSWTNSVDSPPNVTFTMMFNNCVFTSGNDSVTVNGTLTVSTTATQYTFTGSGFSVVGTANGNAVDFSCAMDIAIALSPFSYSGSLCGISFAPPAAPTGLAVGSIFVSGACQVPVSWAAESTAQGYNVYWTYDGSTPTTAGTPTPAITNSATINSGVAGAGTFNFIVTGLNAAGEGPPSSPYGSVSTSSECG